MIVFCTNPKLPVLSLFHNKFDSVDHAWECKPEYHEASFSDNKQLINVCVSMCINTQTQTHAHTDSFYASFKISCHNH